MVTVAQAEKQIRDVESQLATSEQQVRSQFVPGTIESQFRFGSARNIKLARQDLARQKKISFGNIALQRESLEETKQEVATAKKVQQAQQAQQQKEATRQQLIRSVQNRLNKGKGFGVAFQQLSKADQKLFKEAKGRSERAIISSAESKVGQTLSGEARGELLAKGSISIPGISLLNIPQQTLAKPSDLGVIDIKPQFLSDAPLQSLVQDKGFFKTTTKDVGSLLEFAFVQPFKSASQEFTKAGKQIKQIDTKDSKLASIGTQTLGTGFGIVGEVIPQTKVGVGFLVVAPPLISKAPVIVQQFTGIGIGILGGKQALDSDLSVEQRGAGALFAVGGFGGAALAGKPLPTLSLREQGARASQIAKQALSKADKALAKSLSGRLKTLETLDIGAAKLKLDAPSALGSVVKKEQTLGIALDTATKSQLTQKFSGLNFKSLGLDKPIDVTRGSQFSRTELTISRPTKAQITTGALGDIQRTVDFQKIAPLTERGAGALFKDTSLEFVSVSKGIETPTGALAQVGLQSRVGSGGRLRDDAFFTVRKGAKDEFAIIETFKPARKTTKKVGEFEVTDFRPLRSIGTQRVDITSSGEIGGKGGLSLSRLRATTELIPDKRGRISADEFLTRFGESPTTKRGLRIKEEERLIGSLKLDKQPLVDVKLDISPKGLGLTSDIGTTQKSLDVTLTRRLPQVRPKDEILNLGRDLDLGTGSRGSQITDLIQTQKSDLILKSIPTPKLSKSISQPKGTQPTTLIAPIKSDLVSGSTIFSIPASTIKPFRQASAFDIDTSGKLQLGLPTTPNGTPGLVGVGGIQTLEFDSPLEKDIGGLKPTTLTSNRVSTRFDTSFKLDTSSGLDFRQGLEFGLGLAQPQIQIPRDRLKFGEGLLEEQITSQTGIFDFPSPTGGKPTSRVGVPFRDILGVGGRGFIPPFAPSLGGFGVGKRKKPSKKRKRKVRPSFTASVLDLEAFERIKISPEFGISPFTIRRKLVKRSKKKKVTKKKVTKKKVTKKKKK